MSQNSERNKDEPGFFFCDFPSHFDLDVTPKKSIEVPKGSAKIQVKNPTDRDIPVKFELCSTFFEMETVANEAYRNFDLTSRTECKKNLKPGEIIEVEVYRVPPEDRKMYMVSEPIGFLKIMQLPETYTKEDFSAFPTLMIDVKLEGDEDTKTGENERRNVSPYGCSRYSIGYLDFKVDWDKYIEEDDKPKAKPEANPVRRICVDELDRWHIEKEQEEQLNRKRQKHNYIVDEINREKKREPREKKVIEVVKPEVEPVEKAAEKSQPQEKLDVKPSTKTESTTTTKTEEPKAKEPKPEDKKKKSEVKEISHDPITNPSKIENSKLEKPEVDKKKSVGKAEKKDKKKKKQNPCCVLM